MSRKKRDLTDDERKLWRRVTDGLKPRRAVKPVIEAPPAASPRLEPILKRQAPAAPSPSKRFAPPPPADRGAEKRVRRGKIEIDAKLDLHGYKQDDGFSALMEFLFAAHRRGARTALVVTGVGRAGEGVLKRRLPDWLGARELKPLIAGYAQAHRTHGGAGAFYVFLKRRE